MLLVWLAQNYTKDVQTGVMDILLLAIVVGLTLPNILLSWLILMKKYNWFIFVGILVAFTATLLLVRADNENKIRANLVADWQKFYVKKEQEVAYIDTTPHKSKHMALSEAQGYGMEIAAMNPHGKKADFDHLYRYYLANRETGSQLMSWKQVKDVQN